MKELSSSVPQKYSCILYSWTYLPGLQFILAGVVGKTGAYFGVPAMRLALDVLVYIGVIAVFVLKMLVLRDVSTIKPWEVLWLVYLVGAIWQQVRNKYSSASKCTIQSVEG